MKMSLEQYIELNSSLQRKSRPMRRILLFALGIVFLLSPYTFIIGVLLLALFTLILFIPKIVPFGATSNYKSAEHLHQPLTYSVSEKGLRVYGETIDLKSTWPNLKIWRIRDDWLILSSTGMTALYFKVADLKEAGVFDELMKTIRKHAVEYDSPEAKAL